MKYDLPCRAVGGGGGGGESAEPPSKLMLFMTIVVPYGISDGSNNYFSSKYTYHRRRKMF